MLRKIVMLTFAGVIAFAAFMFLFQRDTLANWVDSARGYPQAKSPQQCVDLFLKAVKERKFDKAAKYCTKDYAEQLEKSADAARELGVAIDDLKYRMEKDGVGTSEMNYVIFVHDPLPTDITLTLQVTGESKAEARFAAIAPVIQSQSLGTWDLDTKFQRGLYFYVPQVVQLNRDGGNWKIDVPVVPAQREQVERMVSNHKDYVNAFKKMSEELRVERTTKVEVERRFKELLTEAVKSKK